MSRTKKRAKAAASTLRDAPCASTRTLAHATTPPFCPGAIDSRAGAGRLRIGAALRGPAANYQRVVLEALRSVADALSAVEQDAQTLAALARSAQAAQEQHRVAVSQHRAGAASPVQLLVADQLLLQARNNLAAAQAQRLLDTVALGAALAGETVLGQNPQVPLRHPQE